MTKRFNSISSNISTETIKEMKKIVVANALLDAEDALNEAIVTFREEACELFAEAEAAKAKAEAEAKIVNNLATILSEQEALDALCVLKDRFQQNAAFSRIVAKAEAKAKKKAAKAEAKAKKAEARAKAEAEKTACRKAIREKLSKLREAAAVRAKAKAEVEIADQVEDPTISKNAIMTRDVMGKEISAKENISHTKIALVDRLIQGTTNEKLLTVDDRQRYGIEMSKWESEGKDGYFPLIKYGRNGLVETTVLVSKNEYIREMTDNFEDVESQYVCVNTDSGYVSKLVEDYTEEIIELDVSEAFRYPGDSVVVRYVKNSAKATARKCVIKNIAQIYDIKEGRNYYLFYDKAIKKWIRLDGKISKSSEALDISKTKEMKYGVVSDYQISLLMKKKEPTIAVNYYVVFNASAAALRTDKCLFTICNGCEDEKDLIDHLEKVYDRTTSGLFSIMTERIANEIYIKAIKNTSRLALNITEAALYPNVIDAFCRFNGKYVTLAYEDDKPVEFADGLYLLSDELLKRLFFIKFGNEIPSSLLAQNEGNIVQNRIGCTIKGLGLILSRAAIKAHLTTLKDGKLSLGEKGRIILIKDQEAEDKYYKLINKYDVVFSGPAYADIEPDEDGYVVTDEEKIKLLFERVIVVGDMNAFKFARNFVTSQDTNIMAFPPKFSKNGKINMSNQFCTSIMYDDNPQVDSETGKILNEGLEVLLQIVEENVTELLENTRKDADHIKPSDLKNFRSFGENVFMKINSLSALQDPFTRNKVMKDIVTEVYNIVNNMNVRVSGFNAVGFVDIGLILYGVRTLEPNQMFTGNVGKNETKDCLVMRSPKISRMEYIILTDIGKNIYKKQILKLEKEGKLPQGAFKVIWSIIKNIRGRVAVLPSYRRILVNLLGGSDFDGDIYAIITEERLVNLMKGKKQFGIAYGSFEGPDEKVSLHALNTDIGNMSPARLIMAYYETGNPIIGILAHINMVKTSLTEMIERGKLTDENFEEVFYNNVMTNDDEPESEVFEPGKPEYQRFFNPNYNEKGEIVLADAETIDAWCDYCFNHSIENVKALYTFTNDFGVALSSIMGRDIDAAKSVEKVYVAFLKAFNKFESAYWKGTIGLTDVEIVYIAETSDENDRVELGKTLKPGINIVKRGPAEEEIMLLDDNAHEFKNRAAESAVKIINDWLSKLNEDIEEAGANGYTSKIKLVNPGGTYSGFENLSYINTGVMTHRRDIRNDIAPYIVNTMRRYTMEDSVEKRLGLALQQSYLEKKKETIDKSELNLDMTRFYNRLSAEIALIALHDRFKTTGETSMQIRDRVHTTCDYMFYEGEELFFENGVAIIEGGKALCEDAEGIYHISIAENGIPYAVADLEEYLKNECEPNNLIIFNVFYIEKYGNKLIDFINDPQASQQYCVVSKIFGKSTVLYKVNADENSKEMAERIANISVVKPEFNVTRINPKTKVREFKNTQLRELDSKMFDIDRLESYINSKGKKYNMLCMSAYGNIPKHMEDKIQAEINYRMRKGIK